MKFLVSAIALLAFALAPAYGDVVPLRFDANYGNPNGSLTTVACSTGSNGLITKGFTTFGSLPNFPDIGAAQVVTEFNSVGCGTCWNVSFTNATDGTTRSLNILAIDVAAAGFNVAQQAMDNLTDNQAVQLGVIQVNSTQVNASACGLSD